MLGSSAAEYARASLAMPHMRSAVIGFCLCGIELEPFCASPNDSRASATSPCAINLISVARASQIPTVSETTCAQWTKRSRIRIWLATSAGVSSNSYAARVSTSREMSAYVPVGPLNLATATSCPARASRMSWRSSAIVKSATR